MPLPNINDIDKITSNSNNERLGKTSYPHLQNQLPQIIAGYTDYDVKNGNPHTVNAVAIANDLKEGLKSNYKSPPKDLKFINEIRTSSPNVCPMCGSLKTGTLDHLFPKEDYPWFSVYSKNLVPACDCNSKRGQNLTDGHKRILHPYYDQFLTQRLLSCKFTTNANWPHAKVVIDYVNPTHQEADSIQYHTEKVVLPSGLIGWLEGEWDTATLSPFSKIQTLPLENIATLQEFKRYLEDAMSRHDRAYGTPNNWFSIFIHGILNSAGCAAWLHTKHNQIFP
ncbi:hypothetical protein [Colwellia sp. UCD-KL20]|uniref:hypothetical protein n=1 Tax=Colwellia sp. UCD-KL20 TaxID=1917165 RepID=UPI00117799EF|nr:hypothetical protein [Colwellia sp. UCD-KL20]